MQCDLWGGGHRFGRVTCTHTHMFLPPTAFVVGNVHYCTRSQFLSHFPLCNNTSFYYPLTSPLHSALFPASCSDRKCGIVPEQEVWVGEGNTCIPGRFEYTVQEVVFSLHFVFLVECRSLHQHQHLSEWKSTETRCAALVAVGDKY